MLEHLKSFETERSVWVFNTDESTFLRFPKDENPANHPGVRYHEDWQPYESLTFRERSDGWVHVFLVGERSVETYIPQRFTDFEALAELGKVVNYVP